MTYRDAPTTPARTLTVRYRRRSWWRAAAIGALALVAGGFLAQENGRTATLECRRHIDGEGTCVVRLASIFSSEAHRFTLNELQGAYIERVSTRRRATYELYLLTERAELRLARASTRTAFEVDVAALDAYRADRRPLSYQARWGNRTFGLLTLLGSAVVAGLIVFLLTRRAELSLDVNGGRLRIRRKRFGCTRTLLDAPVDGVSEVRVDRQDRDRLHQLVIDTRVGDTIALEETRGFSDEARERAAEEIAAFLRPR